MIWRRRREVPESLARRADEARNLYDRGAHAQAEAQIRAFLPVLDDALGESHPEAITLRNLLGSVLFQQRKFYEAARLHREAMQLGVRVFGRNNPRTLAYAHNYGTALLGFAAGEGIAVLEDALRRRTRRLGRRHEDTLATANALGAALFSAGAVAQGITVLRKAHDESAGLRPGHPVREGIAENLRIALRNSRRW
jgi:tetratricopeptide (TPR) repeat protein